MQSLTTHVDGKCFLIHSLLDEIYALINRMDDKDVYIENLFINELDRLCGSNTQEFTFAMQKDQLYLLHISKIVNRALRIFLNTFEDRNDYENFAITLDEENMRLFIFIR